MHMSEPSEEAYPPVSIPGSLRIVLPEAYHLEVTTDGEGRILYERISNVLSCSSRTSNVHRGHQVAKGKDRKSLGVELAQSYRRAKDDFQPFRTTPEGCPPDGMAAFCAGLGAKLTSKAKMTKERTLRMALTRKAISAAWG